MVPCLHSLLLDLKTPLVVNPLTHDRLGKLWSVSVLLELGPSVKTPEWTLSLLPHLTQSRGGKDTLRRPNNGPQALRGGSSFVF